MDLACTKAFSDDQGNRFIYPSMVRWPQDPETPAKADLILQAMSLDLALGTKADEGWFEFDPTVFPHVRMNVLHRNFAHGGATALCFAGPMFYEAFGDREGHGTERPQASPQPRDEPLSLPSPDNTNPEAEHG